MGKYKFVSCQNCGGYMTDDDAVYHQYAPEEHLAFCRAECQQEWMTDVAAGRRAGPFTPLGPVDDGSLPPVTLGDPRFLKALDDMRELHVKKAADYGDDDDLLANLRASEPFGIPAWVGAMVRLNDKVKRLQSFVRKGKLANESAIDSMNDIACYAILARILYEEAA